MTRTSLLCVIKHSETCIICAWVTRSTQHTEQLRQLPGWQGPMKSSMVYRATEPLMT